MVSETGHSVEYTVGQCVSRSLHIFTIHQCWHSMVLASVHLCAGINKQTPGSLQLCSSLPGNCFGEDGCQQIQDFVDSNGLSEVFQPLDEDEGSEGEDNEGEDGEVEGKDEVQELGDDEEGELVKDEHLQVKGEKIDVGRTVRLVEEELGDVSSASRTA